MEMADATPRGLVSGVKEIDELAGAALRTLPFDPILPRCCRRFETAAAAWEDRIKRLLGEAAG